jgi:hypothetical protein
MKNRELDALLDICRASGATVTRGKNGHWQVLPADKKQGVITISGTPSDYRAIEKIRSQLRRAGMQVPHKGGL